MKSNRFIFTVALCGFLTILFSADYASAQGAAGNAIGFDSGEENKQPPFPINMFLSISHSVGQGTFLLNPNTNATSDHGLENNGVLDYASNPNVSSFASATIIAKVPALKLLYCITRAFRRNGLKTTLRQMHFNLFILTQRPACFGGAFGKGL